MWVEDMWVGYTWINRNNTFYKTIIDKIKILIYHKTIINLNIKTIRTKVYFICG